MNQVTIKDLAKQLNISVTTVSRALRNAADVNQQTKLKVLALAQQLRYQPNAMAQGLVKRKTKIIGIVVPAIHSNYFSQALSGMTEVASEFDYHLMFCQTNENIAEEVKSIKKLVSCQPEGLLISVSKETTNPLELEKVQQRGIPIVLFDRTLENFLCNKVVVDEYEGAYRAVEHLIKKGCKNIAHLSGPLTASVSLNRLRGYKDALKQYGLVVNEKYIRTCNAFEEDALSEIKKLLLQRPRFDGLFCINDLTAIIAMKYMQKKGIRIPQDIKVVGFNDDPVSSVVEPSLTTVRQPGYEVGKLAMRMLVEQILSPQTHFETVQLRTQLIPRNSSR